MKADKLDVKVPCFGDIRGCLVAHCDVAAACTQKTLENERESAFDEMIEHVQHEVDKRGPDSAEIDHDDPINRG